MKSLQLIERFFSVKNLKEEPQNEAYEGCLFSIDACTFRSRLAKKTPKKKGYFVVFWEKDVKNKNQAYAVEKSPDIMVITIIDGDKCGQFLFPKEVLRKQGILRNGESKGKMGVRVYPIWETDLNPSALKTQKWQIPYFIAFNQGIKTEDLQPFYFC